MICTQCGLDAPLIKGGGMTRGPGVCGLCFADNAIGAPEDCSGCGAPINNAAGGLCPECAAGQEPVT